MVGDLLGTFGRVADIDYLHVSWLINRFSYLHIAERTLATCPDVQSSGLVVWLVTHPHCPTYHNCVDRRQTLKQQELYVGT